MKHVLAPGIEIRFDRETEVVESMHGTRKPDPNWLHFDKNGHAHAWRGDELPTVYEKVTGTTWVGDEIDGYEDELTDLRCKICDEIVKPKYVMDYSPVIVAGPAQYTLKLSASIQDQEWPVPTEDVETLIGILHRMFSRGG